VRERDVSSQANATHSAKRLCVDRDTLQWDLLSLQRFGHDMPADNQTEIQML